MGTQLKQVERPIATKNDDELEVIDLTSCTAEENEDLSDLNKRVAYVSYRKSLASDIINATRQNRSLAVVFSEIFQ